MMSGDIGWLLPIAISRYTIIRVTVIPMLFKAGSWLVRMEMRTYSSGTASDLNRLPV